MKYLVEQTSAWGMSLTAAQIAQFECYAAELQQWNAQQNLTSVADPAQIETRHFLDSLRLARSWGTPPMRMADLGTGAGLPGIPLKILHPAMQLTLVESVGKKTAFLEHLVAILGFADVIIINQRAETLGQQPQHREQYDLVTARALAELRVLAEYALPLCRVGGMLLAPKGPHPQAELTAATNAIGVLGGEVQAVEPVVIAGEPARTLVVIRKAVPTPPRYPRAIGIPSKRPL